MWNNFKGGKMKKIIFITLCIFLLSGCSASATFDVKSSEKTKENVLIFESLSNIDTENQDIDELLSDLTITYESDLNNGNYKYRTFFNDNLANGEANKSYDDVCSAFNNSIFIKQFFYDFSCDIIDGYYYIKGKENYFSCDDDCMELPIISKATLKIKLPKKAISNNADEIEGNTYTWNFEEGQGEKVVELKFKQNKIVSIIKSNTKKDKKNIIIIIFGISILLLLLIFGLYSKYKKTKISL